MKTLIAGDNKKLRAEVPGIRRKNAEKHKAGSTLARPQKKKRDFPGILERQKRIFGDMVLSDEDSEKIFKHIRGE